MQKKGLMFCTVSSGSEGGLNSSCFGVRLSFSSKDLLSLNFLTYLSKEEGVSSKASGRIGLSVYRFSTTSRSFI